MNGGNTAIHSGNIGTYLANKLTIEDAPQNTDMNTITSSKIVGITYTEGTNQTNLHTPLGETTSGYSTVSYYNVETISYAGGYRLCQVAWSCFSHNSGMWYRTKHDANWNAWKKILTEDNIQTGLTYRSIRLSRSQSTTLYDSNCVSVGISRLESVGSSLQGGSHYSGMIPYPALKLPYSYSGVIYSVEALGIARGATDYTPTALAEISYNENRKSVTISCPDNQSSCTLTIIES